MVGVRYLLSIEIMGMEEKFGSNYLYWWSKCAFSILLSLARRFWNQIFICVSVRSSASASSNLRGLDIYSFLWYSSSNLRVWSEVKVVLCRLCLGSLRLRLATTQKKQEKMLRLVKIFRLPTYMPLQIDDYFKSKSHSNILLNY